MGKLKDELRKKYRSPREALKALGLDEKLLDVRRLAFDGAKHMKPTVLKSLAVRFTARAVNPLLMAMDSKGKAITVDYAPLFKGLNTKNLKQRKPVIMDGLKKALKGKTIAKDASIEHVAEMLDHLEHVTEPKSLDELASGSQHRAMEAAAHGHSNLGIPAHVGKEFEHADKGKTFRDALPDWLKGKGMSDDDVKHVMDGLTSDDEMPDNALDEGENVEIEVEEAEDDEIEQEEAEDGEIEQEEGEDEIEQEEGEDAKHAKDRKHGKDSKHAKDRKRGAMDGKQPITQDQLDKALKVQATTLRKNAQEAAEARAFVRPYVGEVSMALDSAEQIHRAAAEAMGIEDADKVHASALKTFIKTVGSNKTSNANDGDGGLALDGAAAKSFDERFPDAKRIGTA